MDIVKHKRVLSKIAKYNNYVRRTGVAGIKPRTLYINPNNVCNFSCKQCFAASSANAVRVSLSIERLRSLADEADELGIYEIDIQGGEPLVFHNLFEILDAFGPERFYLSVTSNGYLLDEAMANRLFDAGVSRVVVSLDSLDGNVHDEFRGKAGAFQRALDALENVKNAGIQPSVNFLVGHHNVQTGEIERVCDFCVERNYQVGLITAKPVGNWQGNLDIMLDEKDTSRLNELRGKYKNVWRDLWPAVASGDSKICCCPIVTRPYITPHGEVFPCPYVHVTLGNIYKKSLREILEFGFSIKYFRQNSEKCLSGEDKGFVKKFLLADMSVMQPLPAKEVFSAEDFIAG